jgi:hypothetical protein
LRLDPELTIEVAGRQKHEAELRCGVWAPPSHRTLQKARAPSGEGW